MTVGLVGGGPSVEAIESAFEDVGYECIRIGLDGVDEVELPIVTAASDSNVFDQVNRSSNQWIAVELGGIGGHVLSDVDAAISLLGPDAGCYDCLCQRVASNLDRPVDGEATISRCDARLAGAHAGREAVALLTGERNPGRVLELPYVERRLLAVPGCSCGTVSETGIERDDANLDLEEVISRAEISIDERIGLVSSIGEVESFPAPYYLATLADTSVFSDADAGPQAAGVAVNWNEAFVKAVGEAIERYAAGVYRKSLLRFATAAESDDVLSPDAFVLPESYADPDSGDSIPWISGENLSTGEDVDLPAEFVYFPPPEKRYKPSITTGLGLGSSTVGAILSGLYETIERDATMLAWYSTFEPLGLSVDDAGFETLARRAGSEGLVVTPLLVTQDIDVPVVSVAVHRDGEWPRFAVGSGADLDPNVAARSALAEALQNWMELRGMGREQAAEESTAIGRYADFPREARSFVSTEDTVPASDVQRGDVPTGTEELEDVLDRVESAGLDAYAARLTPRDVETLGFEAVRVLVPAAQPLFTGERYFGERARRIPRDLGFRPRFDRGPHPYP